MESKRTDHGDQLNEGFCKHPCSLLFLIFILDEAQKWLKIAETAYKNADYQKALKFINKAYLLYPTNNTKKLKKIWEEKLNERWQQSEKEQEQEHDNNKPKHRKHQQPRNYTSEDHAICQKVLEKNNYYDVLGFTQMLNPWWRLNKSGIWCVLNIETSEIKKSYKKLSLKCHPDKNGSPLANEAFKLLSKAAAFLINPEKGRNERNSQQRNPNEPYEFDPFDVFDSFFKNSNKEESDHRANELKYIFYAFAPIMIIIIWMAGYNIIAMSFKNYSLTQTGSYQIHLQTDRQKIGKKILLNNIFKYFMHI